MSTALSAAPKWPKTLRKQSINAASRFETNFSAVQLLQLVFLCYIIVNLNLLRHLKTSPLALRNCDGHFFID